MELSWEIKLSRQELYERVWGKPLRDVARELGMSDVGLAKYCRRSGIPLPPRGFHVMPPGPRRDRLVVRLPDNQDHTAKIFSFRLADESVVQARSASRAELAELALAQRCDVPDLRRKIETRLKALRRQLDARRTDDRGVIVAPSVDFALRVSPACLDRAMEIFARLSERVLRLGGDLGTGEGWRSDAFCLDWQGYQFAFKLEEATSRQPITSGKRNSRPVVHYRGEDWVLVPTGKLTLDGRGPGYEHVAVRDGKVRIEERLDEIAERMYELVAAQRETDRIKAIREQRAIAHLRRKDDVRRNLEFEERRRRQLHTEARQYRHAEALRQYISAVERSASRLVADDGVLESRNEWLQWAKSYADSLDPITSNRAAATPSFPEPKEITEYPSIFLRYDDPEEAEAELKRQPWHTW